MPPFSRPLAALRSFSTSCSGSSPSPASLSLPPIITVPLPIPLPYSLGLTLQESLVARRARARTTSSPTAETARIAAQDVLLLLEHTPVYTVGRREAGGGGAESPEGRRLTALGADYFATQRGGKITFHGPGQLVGYPILNLGPMNLSTRCYVSRLEQTLIHLLQTRYDIASTTSEHTGVWSSPTEKIASIGIQIRHRVTSHGFALNVERRVLDWFAHIVACGIEGASMSSVESVGRERVQGITVKDAVPELIGAFGETFGRRMVSLGEGEGMDEELEEIVGLAVQQARAAQAAPLTG